ncbi:MAG: hypothetical protein PHR26_02765 [Candidatus ainarchaeum sp.]|nr:hypothetical protein [Candidatus ainarchaeum sp.]MDD3975742.1 hypothetical protein [Candidatus ainarchaeum sp.]
MPEQSGIYQDIKALQSSLLVLRQKIKYLVHNEKILGRNILVLNKKIASKTETTNNSTGLNFQEIKDITKRMDNIEKKIEHLEHSLELFSKKFAKEEDLKEMKYIIDNINPLEYATISQVKKIIKENK